MARGRGGFTVTCSFDDPTDYAQELCSIFDSNSFSSFNSNKEDIDQVLLSFDSNPFINWEVSITPRDSPTVGLEGTESYLQPILSM